MKQNRSVASELIAFSLPMIMSGILQQLYSLADAFIVGRSGPEGEMMLAAVGATGNITFFLLNTMIGFTLGLSIMAGQEFGRGNTNTIRKITTIFLPVLFGVYAVLSAGAAFLIDPILKVMNTPAEIFDFSREYLVVVLIGIPFLAVYNLFAGLFRAVGNTKAAFYAILISSILNIVLDILFVWVFPWGVIGAAAATVLSQIAMTAFLVFYGFRTFPELMPCKGSRSFDNGVLRIGTRFGFPPAIQNSVTSLGNLVLQNFMNGFGAITVLAVTTAYRVDGLILLPIFHLGAAISSLAAQAKGAGDSVRLRNYLTTGMKLMIAISVVLTALTYLFGADFIAIFGVTGQALEEGRVFFQDLSLFYLFFGIATVLRSVLEGVGDLTCCSMMGMAVLAFRIAISYILSPYVAERSIAFAEGFAWCALLLLTAVRIYWNRKEFSE